MQGNGLMSRGRAFPFVQVILISTLSAVVSCGNPFEVVATGEPSSAETCAALGGTFQAVDVRVQSLADPAVTESFSRPGTTFRIEFNDENDLFQSTFIQPGTPPVVRTGNFVVEEGNVILASEPLVPGIQRETTVDVGGLTFTCRLTDGGLSLVDDQVRFDFDNDGIFEPALFDATFEPDPFPGP